MVPHDRLLAEARRVAAAWVAEGRTHTFRGGATRDELRAINAAESERVADAFLDTPFLSGQYKFLWSRGKRLPAAMFFTLRVTRPLWARLL